MLSNLNNLEGRLQNEVRNREEMSAAIRSMESQINNLVTCSTTTMTQPLCSQATAPYHPHHNMQYSQQPLNSQQQFSNPTPGIHPAQQISAPPANPIQILLAQLHTLEDRFNISQQNIQYLITEVSEMKKELANIKSTINDDQQHNRRNNLLVHGLNDVPVAPNKPCPEYTKQFTCYIVNKLNELFPDLENDIVSSDIDNTHIYRTKQRFDAKSSKQVVIIRFVSVLRRNEIFSLKRTLKDTPIGISEHLTKTNLDLYKKAQKEMGDNKKVWTHYGRVLIDFNGSIKSIRNIQDLHFYWPPKRTPPYDYHYEPQHFPHMTANAGNKHGHSRKANARDPIAAHINQNTS